MVDGTQPQLAVVAGGIAAMPLLTRHGEGPYSGGKRMAPRRIEIRTLYNPEKRTAVQIVPALIGVILTMTMVLFTSGAIVRERERGNLELLIATPLSSLELMVGKLLPYVAIGLIQTTIILIVGAWLFSVPVVGRLVDLYAAALVFIAATLGLGLFVSMLPLTHFNVIIRGIMLRGADLPEAWLQLLKLAAFLTFMMLVAVARFKKRL